MPDGTIEVSLSTEKTKLNYIGQLLVKLPNHKASHYFILKCYKDNIHGKITWTDYNGDNKVDFICRHYDGSKEVYLSMGGNMMKEFGELDI